MKYIFFAITYFYSSYTEEEINDLEAVVSMLFYGALQRINNTYIESICFSELERDPRYVGLIGKKILKKAETVEKSAKS